MIGRSATTTSSIRVLVTGDGVPQRDDLGEGAFVADAIDDAVFILGPERVSGAGRATDDAGAVIVDGQNRVWISKRLEGRVTLLSKPTDGV